MITSSRFNNIDPMDPAREFYFAVCVTEDNGYVLSDVSAPVADVDALLAELNQGNDFARFVREMRVRFRGMV